MKYCAQFPLKIFLSILKYNNRFEVGDFYRKKFDGAAKGRSYV